MSKEFDDLDASGYQRQRQADMRRARMRVVRSHTIAAEETEADKKLAEDVQILALGTDAANFLIADLAACAGVRAFVDAVMGVAGGSEEFVFIADRALADRMAVSTATVAKYRKLFVAVKNHSALIEIKPNYRHPETLESFPHRYRCKLTALAVETMQNAQLAPGWTGDADAKTRAMKEAAETVARGASFGPLTPPKKRRKPTAAEVVDTKLKTARKALEDARKMFSLVRNPDFEQLAELFEAVETEVKATRQAFGFATPVSMQIQREEGEKTSAAVSRISSDAPDLARRIGAEDLVSADRIQETENAAQVEKFLTRNDSTESTVYENREFSDELETATEIPPDRLSPGEDEAAMYAREVREFLARKAAEGKTEAEAYTEVEDEIGDIEKWRLGREQIFDWAFAGLKGGGRGGG